MKKHVFLPLILALLMVCCLAQAESAYKNRTLLLEDDYADSMVLVDGTLYLLGYEGLYTLVGDELLLTQPAFKTSWDEETMADSIHQLLSDGKTLYGLNVYTMVLYRLDLQTGTKQPVLTAESLLDSYYSDMFITDTQLVCLADNKLLQIDLATGAETKLDAKDITQIAAYQDGLYAALERKRTDLGWRSSLLTIDASTGARTVLETPEVGVNLRGITAAADGQSICLADVSQLYIWKPGQKAQAVASFARGDVCGMVMLDANYVIVNVDTHVFSIRALDPALNAAQKQLNLLEPLGRGEDYLAFLKTHGDTDINFIQHSMESNEELFIQHMLTKSDAIDIFLLSDQNLLSSIKSKGYGVDLSQNASIQASVADMYAPIRESLTENDVIVAVPKKLFLPILAYQPEAFQDLNLTCPTTYAEFLQFYIAWMEEGADEHPGYYVGPLENYLDFGKLIKCYVDEMTKNGKPVDYQSAALQEVLQLYIQAQALPVPDFDWSETALFNIRDVPVTSGYAYLPLTFEAGNDYVFNVSENDFDYFVVNPYSKRKTEAMEFLALYLGDMGDWYNVILYTSKALPVEHSDFNERVAAMELEIEQLETQLAAAPANEKQALQESVDNRRYELEQTKLYDRWMFSQEDIDLYKQYADGVYFNPFNPILTLQAEYPELFTAYATNPQFNLQQFLNDLQSRVQMLLAER